ncbi:uncharacterized protein BX663DRAFT_558066 [Cokeromyces recurvatus]|uniref:uncharacterized protein n=1 Tax=Cokeromyces recurvatus TaxID=90255 RepID=UPI0022211D57|nr:uncharacterized protein BX663DRAFT_558066 [Cokeromyces recurvatus]KAI7906398.1 hypothetical protein BX663DRAFT_558066 [Cokeromyces recurvatus]
MTEPTEYNDNIKPDITYYSYGNTKDLAPVIVEIQKKMSHGSLWAKQVHICNADSITSFIQVPMPKMIALVHFITQQEKHIIALDEYMDPMLQGI